MENPELTTQGAGNSGTAVKYILAEQLCPNVPKFHCWSATGGGANDRLLRWRKYTRPKSLRRAEGRE